MSIEKMSEDPISISDDLKRIDFPRVQTWLAQTYWSPGIGVDEIIKGAEGSKVVIGAFDPAGAQVGYMRVISDATRFAYFADVIVDPDCRRQGVASAMLSFALSHPMLKSVYQWLLVTKDAHHVYANQGFKLLEHPESWMMISKGRCSSENQ